MQDDDELHLGKIKAKQATRFKDGGANSKRAGVMRSMNQNVRNSFESMDDSEDSANYQPFPSKSPSRLQRDKDE